MTGSVFSPASLDANRRGQLSTAQEQDLRKRLDSLRGWGLNALFRATTGFAKDVRQGRVLSFEGAIMKKTSSADEDGDGNWLVNRHIKVGNREEGTKTFSVPEEIYEFAPYPGRARLYYLPKSGWTVNLEQLDRLVTADELAAAAGQRQQMSDWKAADKIGQAELLAERSAMARALETYLPGHAPVPGPPAPGSPADPGALAAALVGRWQSPLLSIDVRADGTVTVTGPLAGSGSRSGTWSIGADGRLRTDAMGTPTAAVAMVTGNELTLVLDGQSFRFSRPGVR